MQDQKNIIDCYDKTARNYADQFGDELQGKHLDRMLLKAFAAENVNRGRVIDLGCGPGQTTNYLFDCGLTDIMGIDIAPSMVEVARNIHPMLRFDTVDMLNLNYPENTFGSAIAFYSIAHFDYEQVHMAFKEIKRVLMDNGHFLFSFHIGDQVVHRDDFLNHPVNIDFYFFDTNRIIDLLKETGFTIIDAIERQPYTDVEYPSRRAYIWAKKQTGNKL